MKKFFLMTGLLFAIGFSAMAQNVTDSKGLKQGFWSEEEKGTVVRGYYVNNQKDGAWAVSKNNLITTITNYKAGKRNGVEVTLDNRGQIVTEAWYKDDLLDGRSLEYKYGKVKSDVTYENGLETGVKMLYYDNGKIQEESHWLKGEKDGVTKWFNEQEMLIAEYHYVRGDIVGVAKGYHSNGKLATETTYQNGSMNGDFREFYDTGILKVSGKYADNKKVGTWIFYDGNGRESRKEQH